MKTTTDSVLKKYIISILLTFAVMIILTALLSALFTFADISDSTRKIILMIMSGLLPFLSGFFASRKTNRSGYLTGIIASVFYSLIVILLSSVLYYTISLPFIFKLLLRAIPFGLLGGIMGINSK